MHARIRADKNIPSHFGIMATARTASIVPLAPETHHTPSGRVSRDKLGIPQLVNGGSRLQCSGQGWKVDQGKPVEEICCFLVIMYLYAA